jgi:hypothetical protein
MNTPTDFLREVHPNSPWVLTAIAPDGGQAPVTASFSTDEADQAEQWLKRHAHFNLYYSLNDSRFPKVSKKLDKQGISQVTHLHVDLDPEAGEDLVEAQTRILGLLEDCPQDIPEPTTVIFSGGGYQALWRLAEPYSLGEEPDDFLVVDIERYTKRLEEVFNADACHNVDRILRLPFTTNHPNEKKRARGQKPVEAKVVWHRPDNLYPLAMFKQSVKAQASDSADVSLVSISGNLRRYTHASEIPTAKDGVPLEPWIQGVIELGFDENCRDRWPSNSEMCFRIFCEMAKAGVSDDDMYSVMTDPSFGVSEHVLKQPNVDRYAKRQIIRAKDAAINPKLAELNEKHAIIENMGGSTVVMRVDGRDICFQKPSDFRMTYSNQEVQVGVNKDGTPKMTKLGDWWLAQKDRRQYGKVTFDPTDTTKDAYNLWRGFRYAQDTPGEFDLFMDHLRDNLCDGNNEYFEWLVGWMAFAVQHPEKPAGTAVVMKGTEGTGKGFFARHFGKLFGTHYRHVTDTKHLTGSFNAHLRDCVVLFADEAFFGGDRAQDGKLKTLITEPLIQIERKGVDVEQAQNCIHLIMASNDDWVIPAGKTARRYFVLETGDAQSNNGAYFQTIADQLESGGYAGLLRYLLEYDLTGWNQYEVPRTPALIEQQIRSLQPVESWWLDRLKAGQLSVMAEGWPTTACESDLHAEFKLHCNDLGKRFVDGKQVFIMTLCKRFGFSAAGLDGKRRTKLVSVPTLQEARDKWSKDYKMGGIW